MTDELEQEMRQTYVTLAAFIYRRDRVYSKTGADPTDGIGELVKAAANLRDALDDVPGRDEIDPVEVFDDGDD